MSDVVEFVNLVHNVDGEVTVIDGLGMRVNAKSLMGMLYALEFAALWCESEQDIYTLIEKFAR